jgi:hypothetical protein
MNYNLKNETKYNLSEVEGLVSEFFPFAQKRLGFDKPVNVKLVSDLNNAANPLGKTGAYSPHMMEIVLYVDKRHPKDILRSFSHELVHHTQNCRGEFDKDMSLGDGYAQVDEHMRKMEEEAYLEGQMNLRDWEDNIKKENKVMSEVNLEEAVRQAVRTAFKRILEKKSLEEEDSLKEEEVNEDELEESQRTDSPDRAPPGTQKDRLKPLEEEELDEEELNEEEVVEEDEINEEEVVEEEELYETFTSQKNKMLFETLTKKWAKKGE